MNWCYASASVIGVSHFRAGTRLQDARCCFVFGSDKGDRRFFAVIADGAGSAEFGRQGASIVCRTMSSEARIAFHAAGGLPDADAIRSWLDLARDRICLAASRRSRKSRDFAATMVLVMASHDEVVTAHVGDGAIVARNKNDAAWIVLSAPHRGEYASTTCFVTDDPLLDLRIGRHPTEFDALAAFSDGIENLVIDNATGVPSARFFNSMAKPLDASNILGKDSALSKSLAAFLASDRLNERTDDDKTLIVAVMK